MRSALKLQFLLFSAIGVLFLAPIIAIAYWPAHGGFDVANHVIGRDFINVWTGPRIVDRLGIMALFDLKTYQWAQADIFGAYTEFHLWGYPLPILFIAWPFSELPYFVALTLWIVLGIAAYFAVALRPLTGEEREFAIILLLFAPASLINVVGGQNGFFTAALVLGTVALWDRRPWIAGLLVGILTLKPHLGIIIAVALLTTFAWRIALSASLTAGAMIAASIAVWGLEPWRIFVSETSTVMWGLLMGFEGFQRFMTMSVLASARAFGETPAIAEAVQAVVSVAAIAVTGVLFRRTSDVALRALLVTSGTFLASPYVFNYDMAMVTAAMLWVMTRFRLHAVETAIFGAAWVLPSAVWTLHNFNLGLSPLIYGSLFVIACRLIVLHGKPFASPALLPASPQPALPRLD